MTLYTAMPAGTCNAVCWHAAFDPSAGANGSSSGSGSVRWQCWEAKQTGCGWLQTVRGGARKTERLREMVSEAGQCGELMTLQVGPNFCLPPSLHGPPAVQSVPRVLACYWWPEYWHTFGAQSIGIRIGA